MPLRGFEFAQPRPGGVRYGLPAVAATSQAHRPMNVAREGLIRGSSRTCNLCGYVICHNAPLTDSVAVGVGAMGWSRTNDAGAMGSTRSEAVAGRAVSLVERDPAAAAADAAASYFARPLPIPLAKPAVPPWVPQLSRLLDRRAATRGDFANLRSVERVLRTPGASPCDLPDEVIRAAGLELRWLARRDSPSPALARLLDQFEHELLQPALRRLQRAGPPLHR
ncbi:MAG TPA: hypothetical protein VD932_01635 [Aquabacterium sp.]|nr:hypothetical protein [Aquabacterium sp.]